MKLNKKLLDVAKSASLLSDHYKARIGAVLAYKNDILTVGINKMKSHPLQKKYNMQRGFNDDTCHHYVHAEFYALTKYKAEIPKGSIMYIYRTFKDGQQAYCRPCNACIKAMKDYGVYNVVYSTREGMVYEIFNK